MNHKLKKNKVCRSIVFKYLYKQLFMDAYYTDVTDKLLLCKQ